MSETSDISELGPDADVAVNPDEAPAAAEAPTAQLPGRFLREAREARNLAVYEVAQSLKFSPRQIEAIEADDYAALPPGTTFLRGFVRGYAKLLKLDPLPLLDMLSAQAPAALPDVRAPQNMGVAASPVVASRRSSRPMLLGSAALALLVLALAAWHFLAAPGTPAKAPVVPGSEVAGVAPPQIRVEDATAAGQPVAAAPVPADMRQLIFTFRDKSWVEVKDATNRIVFSAENSPGSRQAVVGKPPFEVVVGNADAVELQYEDRQIDLKPHTRAEVARLTVE
ncbi:MAG: helix-turn-helix domain-containing protein [Rhodocyclales bacterium]|nr:helix-turn-helix domain-containing protein [Rhodocyclales bacterium]